MIIKFVPNLDKFWKQAMQHSAYLAIRNKLVQYCTFDPVVYKTYSIFYDPLELYTREFCITARSERRQNLSC